MTGCSGSEIGGASQLEAFELPSQPGEFRRLRLTAVWADVAMSDGGLAAEAGGANGIPTLTTARLVSEPLQVGHAEELAPLLADQRLHEFIGGRPLGVEELRARFERQVIGWSGDGREGWLNWVVRDHACGLAVGQLQATVTGRPPERAQLAWTIATAFQARGYARKAAAAVADWLWQQGVGELIAYPC